MTKQELLSFLQEATKTEESAIPLYVKHIDSTLFLSGFGEDAQEQIRQILNQLHRGSTRHSKIYRRLIDTVEKEDKDVY
jgi:hypothetical protein